MNHRIAHRIGHRITALALVVGASAIVATPGVASHPDDRPGMLGVGAVSASSERSEAVEYFYGNERATLVDSGRALRPDDRPGMLGVGAVSVSAERPEAVTYFYANERATMVDSGDRHAEALSTAPVTDSFASADDGFEWTAAGIGAGFVVALGLLGALLVASVRRFDRHPA